jgi:hypothetical protein
MFLEFSYKIGETKGRRPFGRTICSWEFDIKMITRDVLWEGVDWIHLVQHRNSGCCEHGDAFKCKELSD